MYNLDQLFIEFSKDISIKLNSDIFETGLFNIIGLIGIVSFNLKNFLGSILKDRSETISTSIENAQNKLFDAQARLEEAKKQLNQIDLVIDEIKNETILMQETLLESEVQHINQEITIYFDRAFTIFQSTQNQVFLEIKNKIIALTLDRLLSQAKVSLLTMESAVSLNDRIINNLNFEGDSL
mmetsp:Transcript_14903/g.22682  ORF Transcript_14903/g.22682 Transcript_14903/m.22682 type:complete len:182 (+) Transcript_14903:83-628(+)